MRLKAAMALWIFLSFVFLKFLIKINNFILSDKLSF
jgi:hypothetical protein